MEKQATKVDVLIIGAGVSGLVSAVKVLEKERTLQIKIIEANEKAGGQIGKTSLGEIGGKWITPDQYHIHKLIREYNVELHSRQLLSPELPRCWDLDDGFTSTPAKYELMRYLDELQLRSLKFRPKSDEYVTGLAAEPGKCKSESMYSNICNRLFFNKSRQFMCNMVRLLAGVNADDIQFVDFISICNSCGGIKSLIDIHLEWPQSLEEVSSESILQVLLDKLKCVPILYSRQVNEIRHFQEHVEVIDSELEVHIAESVILAIPWNSVENIFFVPPIPENFGPPRRPLKCSELLITSFMAQYQEGYWRIAGYSGDFLCSEPFIIGHEYRPTTYAGIVIHENPLEPVIRSLVLQTLAKHFGGEMLYPREYQQHTYVLNSMNHRPLTTSWNRVIWASSAAAADNYRGCLGGAVQSGMRAATKVLFALRPQAVDWNDVAEVQRPGKLNSEQPSTVSIWASTLNLYNVTYYTIILGALIALMRQLKRKYDLSMS